MLKSKRLPLQVLIFLFYKNGDKIEYCLLQRTDRRVWQGVSGGVNFGESLEKAVFREVFEETGISYGNLIELECISSIPSIEVNECFIQNNELIVKEMAYGLEVNSKNIVLSKEHLKYEWLEYEDAVKMLIWDSNKTALWELNYKIENKMI